MRRITTTFSGGLLATVLVLAGGMAPAHAARQVPVLAQLDVLSVQAEYTGPYDRAKFGDWIDADRDGCNTRKEVLIVESVVKPRVSASCAVYGKWRSVFDGTTWTNASDVDIDHHVALSEAWDSGAHTWTATKRRAFANDLGYMWSLNAMTDNMNSSKGDRDPAQWMPPANRCIYVKAWISVKSRWKMSVDPAEKTALQNAVAGSCAGSMTMAKPQGWPS